MRFCTLAVISAFAISLTAHAYEVDNFTDRATLKTDALVKLDEKINTVLHRAELESRKTVGSSCSVAVLRQEILRWIRPDPAGQIEVWLEITDTIEHTHVGIKDSIYKDASFFEAPMMRLAGIGRSFLLNGVVVGTDKVGHFFMQGLSYYDLVRAGKPLDKVLAEDHGEDGIFGLVTTGVKSYADMATNYQGYVFWSQLTSGSQPYFHCDSKLGWVQDRKFTWADYVNPSWDEAINCSEMKPTLQAKADAEIANRGMKCPLEPEKCWDIIKLDHSPFFTSPKCKISAAAITKSK